MTRKTYLLSVAALAVSISIVAIRAEWNYPIPLVETLSELEDYADVAFTNGMSAMAPPGDITLDHYIGPVAYDPSTFDTAFLLAVPPVTNQGVLARDVFVVETTVSPRDRNYCDSTGGVVHTSYAPADYDPEAWVRSVYGDPPVEISGQELADWYAERDASRVVLSLTLIGSNDIPAYITGITNASGTYLPGLVWYSNEIAVVGTGLSPDGDAVLYLHAPPTVTNLDVYTSSNLLDAFGWSLPATLTHTVDPIPWTVPSGARMMLLSLGNQGVDSDNDVLPDAREIRLFGTATNLPDTDGDGLLDGQEVNAGLDPLSNVDSDGDQLSDDWETLYGAQEPDGDPDRDGFLNIYEAAHHGNPLDSNSWPQATHYVSANGSHVAPFATPATAATNIQAALDAADTHDIVMLLDAEYADSELDFGGKSITLSAAGFRTAALDGRNAHRLAEFTSGENRYAVLANLVLKSGAAVDGGAVMIDASGPSILNCRFESNTAGDDAGAIRIKDGATPLVRTCVFAHNRATGDGGALHLTGLSDAMIEECVFDANHTDDDGGALSLDQAHAIVSNCVFTANRGADNGAGIFATSAQSLVVAASVFNANAADDHGGGIYLQTGSDVTVRDCRFTGNFAADGGGLGARDCPVLVDRCRFVRNTAFEDGGALRFKGGAPVVQNTCVANNTAHADGGGIESTANAVVDLINCTLWDNLAHGLGGGAHARDGGLTALNTIFWQNTVRYGPNGNQLHESGNGTADATYCIVQDGWIGTGNLTNFPALIPVSCRLGPGSAAIDAGSANAPATDSDGEARVDHPGASNLTSVVDIGADEVVDTDDDSLADAWETAHFGDTSPTGSADGDGDGVNDALEFLSGANPTLSDTDGDGAADGYEINVLSTVATLADSDGDGIEDGVESANGLDPNNADDALADTDGDGVINLIESIAGTGITDAADPKTNDIVELELTVGEAPESGSASETYALTVGRGKVLWTTNFADVVSTNLNFVRGHSYDIGIRHLDHDYANDPDTPPSPDYDYCLEIDDFGDRIAGQTGDISGDTWYEESTKQYLIHDETEILGQYHDDGKTAFYAGTRKAVLHVIDLDLIELSFSNNHTVVSDDGSTEYEAPHWSDPDADGDASDGHSYPVCYTRNSNMVISAKWTLLPEGLSSNVVIKGTGPSGLNFPETNVSVSGDEVTIHDVLCENAFADEVDFMDPMSIDWDLRLVSRDVWLDAGTSTNQMYVTLGDPVDDVTLHHTVIRIGCENADTLSETNPVVEAIWDEFSDRTVRRVDDGHILTYYHKQPTTNGTADCWATKTAELLQDGDGQCTAWARFFRDVLTAQGIGGTELKQVVCEPFLLYCNDAPPVSLTHEVDGFLIAEWTFANMNWPAEDADRTWIRDSNETAFPHTYDPALSYEDLGFPGPIYYPYLDYCADGQYEGMCGDIVVTGVEKKGQGNAVPSCQMFNFHVIATRGSGSSLILFDPSYGYKSTGANAFQDWDSAHVAGFFELVRNIVGEPTWRSFTAGPRTAGACPFSVKLVAF